MLSSWNTSTELTNETSCPLISDLSSISNIEPQAQLTVWQCAAWQCHVSCGHITRQPTALVAPIPKVVRQISAEDAIQQIIENLVFDTSARLGVDIKGLLRAG